MGGDFYQIIPHPVDGSLLIVAGDVAGKGLRAGMLVALLVGAIRSTSEVNADPLFILRALNRRLLGRGEAHATCLVMRIAVDGAVTLANAGHLPPYVNGQPIEMEGALPLGVIDDAEFTVTHFQLQDNDRLVLASDGIVEAMDEQGQLFGFERVQELLQSRLTAAEVASAAQSFGQQRRHQRDRGDEDGRAGSGLAANGFRLLPHISQETRDTPNFLHAALARAACAPFYK